MVTVEVAAGADATAQRLVEAAERLIGERGLASTSVRSVCAEAGANVAAVHYHFGSKDALVDAVLERRMAELTSRRLELLAPIEARARPSVRDVMDVLVRPLAEFAREPDGTGRAYLRFLAALQASDEERGRIAVAFAPQFDRLAPVLARALPDVAPAVVMFRLDLVSAPLIDTLADPEHALRHWHGTDAPSYDGLVDALVDAVTGTLTGGSA